MLTNDTDNDLLFARQSIGMDEVSGETAALSRKNYSAILRSLNQLGQVHVANNMVVHEATVSRMKSPGGDFERVAVILAACGIELPAPDQRIYPVNVVESLRVLAQVNLSILDAGAV